MDKQIHRDLRAVWDSLPPITSDDNDLLQIRTAEAELWNPVYPHPDVEMVEQQIPAQQGQPLVTVRVHRPVRAMNAALPAVLWIHGGGYVVGSAQGDDEFCQELVQAVDAVVVAVDYRLAPEHPFPAGLNDCYQALTWMARSASQLHLDPNRIAVAGNSAGGGLTASLTLLARDRGGPPIVFQMPLYPMIDDRLISPSSQEITDKRTWNRDHNVKAWDYYLTGFDRHRVSPYAAPAWATDFANLPPAYTMVGSCDLFRDETLAYVSQLCAAGVPTEFHLVPGGFHAFELMAPDAPVSRRARREYTDALKRGLTGTFS